MSYVFPKVGEFNSANKANALYTVLKLHGTNANNIYDPQELESFIILYSINQSIDLQL